LKGAASVVLPQSQPVQRSLLRSLQRPSVGMWESKSNFRRLQQSYGPKLVTA
jgi:hypothetical protein